MTDLPISGRTIVPARDLEWKAVRASGPGGQNVNKVATKIDLRFDLPRCTALPEDVKARLRALYGHRLDAEGRVVVVSESARSQLGNLELARARLADMIRSALVAPKRRRPTRPSLAAKVRRLSTKRQRGERKAERRRLDYD